MIRVLTLKVASVFTGKLAIDKDIGPYVANAVMCPCMRGTGYHELGWKPEMWRVTEKVACCAWQDSKELRRDRVYIFSIESHSVIFMITVTFRTLVG